MTRTAARLVATLVAVAGLFAAPAALGAPAQGDSPDVPTTCLALEVSPLKGPAQLKPDGIGTITTTIANTNEAGNCDDGMVMTITFNGTADAISAIDGGPGVVCSKDDIVGLFAFTERCVAATFPGGTSATISFDVQNVVKQDRIAVEAGTNSHPKPEKDDFRRAGTKATAELMVTVATAAAPAAPSPKPQTTTSSKLPTVKAGDSGDTVTAIQYLLRQAGQDIDADGDFGDQTEKAVRAFQKAKRLTVDGIVGPQTWAALFVTVKKGDQGDAVSAAQTLLAARGQDVEVDGDFGDETDKAVRAFQKAKGLTVDGVVGSQTWSALVSTN
jgi:peptidoglycan hydrolase-like protein with peptidoglycan-binding domain